MISNYKEKTKTDYHRLIVSQFCDFEKGTYGAKLNEATKAFDVHPDPEFWDWMFINYNFKVNCPSFFTTAEGIAFLQSKKTLMNFKPKQALTNVELYGKLGEDKEVKKEKKLLDFIRDGEKESSK